MSNLSVNKLFLNLLSAAILNKSLDTNLFEGLDAATWKSIEETAIKHGVSALTADKALTLPEGCLPPKSQIMAFISHVEQTKALNRKMINVLHKLTDEYQKVNLPFVLLKGLSVGINYPDPLLRNPGDIDLFLYGKGNYKKSIDWISGKGVDLEVGDHIHYTYNFDGIIIENHCRISYFDNRKYDKQFRDWEEELSEKENFTFIEIDGKKFRQLHVEMNAFFIFQHMFRHFVHMGVGFRQYCDWLLFLSKYHSDINPESFTAIAKSYALLHPMQVFALAAVKYLGVSDSIFPFKMISEDKYVDKVIEDIFNSGNFGFYKHVTKRPKGKMRSLLYSFRYTIKWTLEFGSLSPQHIRILPLVKLKKHLKSLLNRAN